MTALKTKAFLIKDCIWELPRKISKKTVDTFKFQYVSILFIKKHLKTLKRSKAAGLDDLLPGMLKGISDHRPLCRIINLSWLSLQCHLRGRKIK